ncbi:MAG: carbon-nitrogen hydrolase family protein [Deltaproteobacteria bacterium]|nr:carbon-nitrogen hydrolase family protein [Deltaproteobacteria bacterium]
MKQYSLVLCAGVTFVLIFVCPFYAESQTVLKVAAVQSSSVSKNIEGNLAHAKEIVKNAADEGAELILLPELMPSGYIISKKIWDMAEPNNGITVQWLRATSKEFGVWLGTTFLEAEGVDFYNTFVLTRPDGTESGRVRKQRLPGHETLFVRGDKGLHVIETDIGRIGIGICFEATLCFLMQQFYLHSVDLVLLPTADPLTESEYNGPKEKWTHDLSSETTQLYAQTLGVPTILANHGGPWISPLPGFLPEQNSWYRGQSTIADSDGIIKLTLEQDEDYIVAEVTLDPSRKTSQVPECFGQYCKEMDIGSRIYQIVSETIGSIVYTFNLERMMKALEISKLNNRVTPEL